MNFNLAVTVGQHDDGKPVTQWVRIAIFGDLAQQFRPNARQMATAPMLRARSPWPPGKAETAKLDTGLKTSPPGAAKSIPAIGKNRQFREKGHEKTKEHVAKIMSASPRKQFSENSMQSADENNSETCETTAVAEKPQKSARMSLREEGENTKLRICASAFFSATSPRSSGAPCSSCIVKRSQPERVEKFSAVGLSVGENLALRLKC